MTAKDQTQLEHMTIENFNKNLEELKKATCYDLALEVQRKNLAEALSLLLRKDVHTFHSEHECKWISRWDDLPGKQQQNYLTLMKQAKDIIEHINNIHPNNPSPNLSEIAYAGLTKIKDHSEIVLNDFKKTVNDLSPQNTNKFIADAAITFASIACLVGAILMSTLLFPKLVSFGATLTETILSAEGFATLLFGAGALPLLYGIIAPNIPEIRDSISQSSYNFFKTAKNNKYDENGFGETFKRNYCKL